MTPLRGSGDEARKAVARCALESCGRTFEYDAGNLTRSSFPFCSPTCKGADLAGWVNETYRVPGLPDVRGFDDEDEGDAPPRAVPDDEDAEENDE
jgi:endogenous inhibitor of DNA gyrase (YacG/DUF329 family)